MHKINFYLEESPHYNCEIEKTEFDEIRKAVNKNAKICNSSKPKDLEVFLTVSKEEGILPKRNLENIKEFLPNSKRAEKSFYSVINKAIEKGSRLCWFEC